VVDYTTERSRRQPVILLAFVGPAAYHRVTHATGQVRPMN